jgi:hypothetical protein
MAESQEKSKQITVLIPATIDHVMEAEARRLDMSKRQYVINALAAEIARSRDIPSVLQSEIALSELSAFTKAPNHVAGEGA